MNGIVLFQKSATSVSSKNSSVNEMDVLALLCTNCQFFVLFWISDALEKLQLICRLLAPLFPL